VVVSLEAQATIEDKMIVYDKSVWKFYIDYLISYTTYHGTNA